MTQVGKKQRARIAWTQREVELIAQRTIELRGPISTQHILIIIKQAQDETLPIERRRGLRQLAAARRITEAVRELESARASANERERPRRLDLETIRQIAELTRDLIVEALRGSDSPQVATQPVSSTRPEATKLPAPQLRLGFVGYDAREQQVIERELGVNCNLRMIFAYPSHNSSSEKLVAKVHSAHVVFARIKWLSHAHYRALKSNLGPRMRFFSNGCNADSTVEAAREWLREHTSVSPNVVINPPLITTSIPSLNPQ